MSRQPSRQIEVTGRYRIASAASDVWSELNNPEALGFAIRHCEHVERLAPHRYRARLKVGVGPVRVPVHAEIEVIPESPPERYALACSMSLRMLGEARAESLVTMLEAGGTVDLDYRAMVAVEGRIAGYGLDYLGGAAERNIAAFFERFGEWMQRLQPDGADAAP